MAPNLQPGERRLPTTDELAQLSWLSISLSSVPGPLPSDPALPVGTALSALLIGRLRRTGYGSWTPVIDSIQIPAPQFELAVNSTLTGLPSTGSGLATGWIDSGNVVLDSSTGAATLGESATADAHLSQTFMLNPGDRTLAFTIANGLKPNDLPHPNLLPGGEGANGAALGSGSGPNDAFEVSLNNVNTGTALVGTDGLSNSDALLNIQTDGTTRTAASVQTIANADGTTTYVIDLQNALTSGAATPVTLSFDLIGFGAAQSQVSIRDIKLLQTPLALNESATTNEDASVNINPLAANPIAPGAAPQLNITQNPASGVLTQNAVGSYAYVPNTHFFGSDSFQYSYTVNGETSNVATVNITVNEVAYPPVGANSSATATAGKPYTFDPLAGASDINGNVMTAMLDTASANGTVAQNADGTWTYTPSATYVGADTLVYHIADGQADSAPVTVSFTVRSATPAPAPVPAPAPDVTRANSSRRLNEAGSVIFNPTANPGLTATVVAQSANDAIPFKTSSTDPGQTTSTPELFFFGHDTFTYAVSDGVISSSLAKVNITVNNKKFAPKLVNSSATFNENASFNLDLLAAASDANGKRLTVYIVTRPTHGTLVQNNERLRGFHINRRAPNCNLAGDDDLIEHDNFAGDGDLVEHGDMQQTKIVNPYVTYFNNASGAQIPGAAQILKPSQRRGAHSIVLASPLVPVGSSNAAAEPMFSYFNTLPASDQDDDKIKPVLDWTAKPEDFIFNDGGGVNKKHDAGSSWLAGFIGAERKTSQDAASLCNLSVTLKKMELQGNNGIE
jgi:hypothetical protein